MAKLIQTPRKAGESISIRFATIFMKPREVAPYKPGGKPRSVYVYNVMPVDGGEADEIEISSFEKAFIKQLEDFNPSPTDVCVITAIPKPGSQYTSLHLSIPEKGLGMDMPSMQSGSTYNGESKAERAERNEKIAIQWALGRIHDADPSLLDKASGYGALDFDAEAVSNAKNEIMSKTMFLLNARDAIYLKRSQSKTITNQQPKDESKRNGEDPFEGISE